VRVFQLVPEFVLNGWKTKKGWLVAGERAAAVSRKEHISDYLTVLYIFRTGVEENR
jgi:hypothetical protein